MTNRDEQVELAKLAEQAELYDDMASAMKTVAESDSELTKEERNLLSLAYKNILGAHWSSWRAMSSSEEKAEGSERKRQMAKEYREKIESRLKDRCYEILILLDTYLIPKATTTESKVSYLKLKGDYYRYLAEIATGGERQKMADESQCAYTDAFNMAKNEMPATHPIRLGLALNFAVFHYEILNKRDAACHMAHQAFNDGLAELNSIDDDWYADSNLILQLIRDNLTLWTSDESDFDNANQPEQQQ